LEHFFRNVDKGGEMRKTLLIALLIIIFATPASLFAGDSIKIGVVDIQRVRHESEAGKRAKSDLESLVKSKQSLIDEKAKAIEKAKGDLEKQASVLSAEARKAKEEELEKMIREYQRFGQDSEAEVNKKRMELVNAITKELVEILDKIGKEEGYTIILDRDTVVYIDKAIDITDKVITKYDESKAKPKKK